MHPRHLVGLSLLPLVFAACADEGPDLGERSSAVCGTWPDCPPPEEEPPPTPTANLVADLDSQANCHPGAIFYSATNAGDATASNFLMSLYKNKILVEVQHVPSLEPGATVTYGYPQLTLMPDGTKYEVRLDPNNTVPELSESDNRKFFQCIY